MGPTPSVNLHYSISLHANLLLSSPRTSILFLVSFSFFLSSYFSIPINPLILQVFDFFHLGFFSLISGLHYILYLLVILFLLHVRRIAPFPIIVIHKMKGSVRGGRIFNDESSKRGQKFGRLKNSENNDDEFPDPHSNTSAPDSSPYNDSSSPFSKSPWSAHVPNPNPSTANEKNSTPNALIGSLVREEGHIYSLAAAGDLLYTGSDSKNIRVWKNHKEFSGFKSNSGLVKAIVIAGEKIFTGHQDGKIRVWKISGKEGSVHKRVGTIPTFRDYIKNSMKPSNYVEVRKHRNTLWIKHFDAISSLSLSEDKKFLYSGSWDKTFKVWRSSDYKCLESVIAHDDAVNSIVAGFDGLVFTGSADGTVKVWRRELQGKGTKHFFSQTLLKQECAVTAVALNASSTVVYCGSSDGLVNFWEREKHLSHGGVLRGHKLAILCLTSAGSLVFSGSADMGICIWRRTKQNEHICLSMLTGHSGPVKCLAVERACGGDIGERKWVLYSGSLDKSVKMWQVSEELPGKQGQSDGGSCNEPSSLPYAPSFSSQGRC